MNSPYLFLQFKHRTLGQLITGTFTEGEFEIDFDYRGKPWTPSHMGVIQITLHNQSPTSLAGLELLEIKLIGTLRGIGLNQHNAHLSPAFSHAHRNTLEIFVESQIDIIRATEGILSESDTSYLSQKHLYWDIHMTAEEARFAQSEAGLELEEAQRFAKQWQMTG